MSRGEWGRITAAAELLGLSGRASLKEIKQAYRRMAKQHHPDLAQQDNGPMERRPMHEITAAYHVLLDYCKNYRFPLQPGEDEEPAVEDWWMDRFGEDPVWGKKK